LTSNLFSFFISFITYYTKILNRQNFGAQVLQKLYAISTKSNKPAENVC